MRRKIRTIPMSTTRVMTPIRMRNTPLTAVPMSPPTTFNGESSLPISVVTARTPSPRSSTSTKTIVEWPSENQNPTESARVPGPVREQLPRGVVDRGDVVGVERVPHPEQVGGQAETEPEDPRAAQLVVRRSDEERQGSPAEHVQQQDEPDHPDHGPLLRAAEGETARGGGRSHGHEAARSLHRVADA